MKWVDLFHTLGIPFLGAIGLTLGKLTADHKLLSFDEANDIALDMVLLGVGALGAFHIKDSDPQKVIDAATGNAFMAVLLLYTRHHTKKANAERSKAGKPPFEAGWFVGSLQLVLGAAAIIWTIRAF